jgi:hypothetical protein
LTHSIVDAAKEHASFTELCLTYLSMPAFSSGRTAIEIKGYADLGTYAFMEYAIVSWSIHLEQVLENHVVHGISPSIKQALTQFFAFHWKAPNKRSRPTKSIQRLTNHITYLGPLCGYIRDSMSAMHCLQTNNLQDSGHIETLDLFTSIRRIRFQIEASASDSQIRPGLEVYYGEQLFKCPRIYCKWYHEGFAAPKSRDLHVQKHERAHLCPKTVCLYATLGYPTAKELEKHIKEAHTEGPTDDDFPEPVEQIQDSITPPVSVEETRMSVGPEVEVDEQTSLPAVPDDEPIDQSQDSEEAQPEPVPVDTTPDGEHEETPSDDTSDDDFENAMTLDELLNGSTLDKFLAGGVKAKRPHASMSNLQTGSSPARATAGPQERSRIYQCEICPKQFTRQHNLNNHLRSHKNERPHACEVCSKTYARLNDMRRHLASHSQKKFICGGTLGSGDNWGCKLRFARSDGLKRHYQSKRGRKCIQPFVRARLAEQRRLSGSEQISEQPILPPIDNFEPATQNSTLSTTDFDRPQAPAQYNDLEFTDDMG